jgi:hypothetical protein
VVSVAWLSLILWGELLTPLLAQRVPQVMAVAIISLIMATGHWWLAGQPFWFEAQQLWADYLQELRQSVLIPHYHQLEVTRQSFSQYQEVYDELRLEEVEAYYLANRLNAQMQRFNQVHLLLSYAQQVSRSCQRLSQLLYQLREGIDVLEMVLLDIEAELAAHRSPDGVVTVLEEPPEPLKRINLRPVLTLSRDLSAMEHSLQAVTQEMASLLAQPIPTLLLSISPAAVGNPSGWPGHFSGSI